MEKSAISNYYQISNRQCGKNGEKVFSGSIKNRIPFQMLKMNRVKHEQGLIIPHEKLSPEALQGLVEEVVTRNGTDNGYSGATLEQNVAMVMGQLRRKEVAVVYDEGTSTANIVPYPLSTSAT